MGLVYFGYRYLNTQLQRWVSADPLQVHSGGADPNLYAYVSGTVLQNVDPLGLEQEAPGAGSSLSPGAGETVRNPSLMDYGKKPAQVVSEPPARTEPKPAGGDAAASSEKVVEPPKAETPMAPDEAENTAMQEALVGAAIISQETPDAIKTDGTGDPLGVPGGECEQNCVRSIWAQVGYLAMAVVGMATSGGKADDVAKAARELGSAVADKVKDGLNAVKKAWKGPTDYSHIPDPKDVVTNAKPTPRQVREMQNANREHNDGVLRDDVTGEAMVPGKQSKRGVTPPSNEAQIDHIHPRSKGGTREMSNLQLRTRKNNRAKSDKIE